MGSQSSPIQASIPSEESRVNEQKSTRIVGEAEHWQVSPSSLSNERAGLSQSHSLIESRNLLINGGQFNHTLGPHTNFVFNISGSPAESPQNSPPLKEIHPISGQSSRPLFQHPDLTVPSDSNRTQVSSFQKSNDIYERHLTLKGRGFPLWIPDPNRVLHLDYRRTGVRIGDVGIITKYGAFSFLFNICLPHNDPVNPRMLPENFAPISPPIESTSIENFTVFKNGSYLASSSVKRSQTGTAISDIVFESSASEGAILTLPRGARSEDLGNLARFREYTAANVADWYRFINGPLGREAKNGDVRLVVGFDKTSSWGIATFANQTQQNSCLLKFGPSSSEGDSSNYKWSEYSGVADVRAGPDSHEIDELRLDGDPPDVQFENQCLFVRTLNATLADDVWADIHSGSGSNPVDPRNSQYPRVKDYSYSNRPLVNNPDNVSIFSPSQGAQSGTERRLEDVDFTSSENFQIFVSGPAESIDNAPHPSNVLNDTLLAQIPAAKMVITHDNDWSSVTQDDASVDPRNFVANILASRDIYQENGVVSLYPKKLLNEVSEGSTSVNRAQETEAAATDVPSTSASGTSCEDVIMHDSSAVPGTSIDHESLNRTPEDPTVTSYAMREASAPCTSAMSTSSSSLRPSLRHADSDSRSTPPENSFTQDYSHLRTSTSTQTLSLSHSHTNSPSPLPENGSTSPGGDGSEMFSNNNLDDRDGSDPDVESTAIQMSESSSSVGKRKAVVVIRASEEEMKSETSTPPVKKKGKRNMHRCEICSRKFDRPSTVKVHMATHTKEKPYPCGFPGCTRFFGHSSNAKKHFRSHGVIPTPASNPNPISPPYNVGFLTPSDSRLTPPKNSFTQDYYHLRTSTRTQTLSSSHSHTNNPSPLPDNGSTSSGGCGSEMFSNNNLDDGDGSDPDIESTAIRMSENSSSAGRKAVVVIRASEEEMKKEASTPPVKKKRKAKMHCCEVCHRNFDRPSTVKVHMATHTKEKPYPCGFPGCTRFFGHSSNAKKHFRSHGVIPTPASNSNPTSPPYNAPP